MGPDPITTVDELGGIQIDRATAPHAPPAACAQDRFSHRPGRGSCRSSGLRGRGPREMQRRMASQGQRRAWGTGV